MIKAGRSLSSRTRQMSPRRGNQLVGTAMDTELIPRNRTDRRLLEGTFLLPVAGVRIEPSGFPLQFNLPLQIEGAFQELVHMFAQGALALGSFHVGKHGFFQG